MKSVHLTRGEPTAASPAERRLRGSVAFSPGSHLRVTGANHFVSRGSVNGEVGLGLSAPHRFKKTERQEQNKKPLELTLRSQRFQIKVWIS